MENIYWSWFWNKYKFNKGRGSLKKIGLYIYLIHIYTFLYGRVFSKQKVSSLGNAINPTFSKGESSEIISLTVPSTYIILIHEPKFFFLEQNLWTTSTLYYGMRLSRLCHRCCYPAWSSASTMPKVSWNSSIGIISDYPAKGPSVICSRYTVKVF